MDWETIALIISNEDSNGWIWVGEKDGLSVFDGEARTAFTGVLNPDADESSFWRY